MSKNIREDDVLKSKKRNGIIILAGGGDGTPDKAISTAKCLLHHMETEVVGIVYSYNTNSVPAKEDKTAAEEINSIAERIKSQ